MIEKCFSTTFLIFLMYKLALFRTNSYYFTIIKLNGQYFLSYFFILFFYTNIAKSEHFKYLFYYPKV